MTITKQLMQLALLIGMCALSAALALIFFGSSAQATQPSWNAAYAQAAPSVVTINSQLVDGATMQGSGWSFDESHIVTNAHVVTGLDPYSSSRVAASSVMVHTHDGRAIAASVVGFDASMDTAVLRVVHGLPVMQRHDQSAAIGQDVAALGSPFAQSGSLTRGIVSMTGRQRSAIINASYIPNLIQTDAPINPGNSGGPLIDMEGRMLGMVTQIQTLDGDHDGIGYAIPSAQATAVAKQIMAHKTPPSA